MTTRFLLTDYSHSWLADTLFVSATTDVACHMYLRWTHVEMLVHLREKRIRGLNVEGNPKYCFVEWLEVEQTEAGDTLTHTFSFPSWGPGECRWWHFRAEISGVPSVSNTGIITSCYLEGPVFTLGIFGDPVALSGSVSLEAGDGISITVDVPTNSLLLS